MPSSWDVYYVVFLSAILSLSIPAFLALVSWATGHRGAGGAGGGAKKIPQSQRNPKEAPNYAVLGKRVNVRFFLAANAALILIALILALVPCIGTLQSEDKATVARGLFAVITIAGFAALGLFYSARKGDLGWLDSFQRNMAKARARERNRNG